MSAEKTTAPLCGESTDDVPSGTILIPQEDEKAETVESSKTKDVTAEKKIVHEVIVEIIESHDTAAEQTTDVNESIVLNYKTEPKSIFHISDGKIDPNIDKANKETLLLQCTDPHPVLTYEVIVEIKESDDMKNEIILNEDSSDIASVEATHVNENTVSNNKLQGIHLVDNTGPNIYKASKVNELPEHTDMDPVPGCSRTVIEQPTVGRKSSVQLFTEDSGPQMYNAKGSLVTAPIITKNLPDVFEYLPLHGKPQDSKHMKEFFSNKIREFVGSGLTDNEFKQLEDYCSPEHLKTGKEVVMETTVPVMGVVSGNIIQNFDDTPNKSSAPDLWILKKNKLRNEKDIKGIFTKKLKYRGVRNLPFTQEVYPMAPVKPTEDIPDVDLEPGKDILYRVRVYRPYTYNLAKDRFTRTRHSVFCCDIILTGKHRLSDLRDRFVCHNDFDMRVDVSNHPDMVPNTKAKEVFPSGFLFINNVFYVDTREGCIDYSEPIRDWAQKKGLGVFPKKDMCSVRLEELILKLGYPEVYVHQGNCEHIFLFSEIRLLNPTDPLRLYNYPCSTAIAQNQTMYCTTCAEFSAKWIVVGCSRVPFDPAFFCETCFRQYLYKDGQKIGDFKAYSYRGNAINVLKPQ